MKNARTITIYVDGDIIDEAKRLGLNRSKIMRNALEDSVNQLKKLSQTNNSVSQQVVEAVEPFVKKTVEEERKLVYCSIKDAKASGNDYLVGELCQSNWGRLGFSSSRELHDLALSSKEEPKSI